VGLRHHKITLTIIPSRKRNFSKKRIRIFSHLTMPLKKMNINSILSPNIKPITQISPLVSQMSFILFVCFDPESNQVPFIAIGYYFSLGSPNVKQCLHFPLFFMTLNHLRSQDQSCGSQVPPFHPIRTLTIWDANLDHLVNVLTPNLSFSLVICGVIPEEHENILFFTINDFSPHGFSIHPESMTTLVLQNDDFLTP